MMLSEPDDLSKAQFSLRDNVQCDATLIACIRNGRVVTKGQYSSQMIAVSLNQIMIDVLWCGDPREKVTQTVTLSKWNGTVRWGLIMVWTEIPLDGRTDMYVFAKGHMTAAIHRNGIREPIVRSYAGAIVDEFILM